MKKFIHLLAAVFALTACNNDSDYTYTIDPVLIANGLFVVQEGSFGKVNGSIGYYDYFADRSDNDKYFSANNVALTGTINDAAICGNNIYILGSDEKTVYVADKNTMKKVTNIKLEISGQTFTPRHAVVNDNYIYVSTYENKVIAIDGTNNTIMETYDCGSYSEGLALLNGFLYVANSDYGYGNASISKINLQTGTTETIKNSNMYNVVDVQVSKGRVFYLDSGSYSPQEPYAQINYGIFELKADGTSEFVTAATEMLVVNHRILGINNPYSYPAVKPEYFLYDIETKQKNEFCKGTEIESPNKISMDQLNGNVLITSRHIISGYPSYDTPGYCAVYRITSLGNNIFTGRYLGKFDCGVGPSYVIPNMNYVQ
ncbi:MAG: hypothetical protein NC344_01360 [Bacteroidales bacterium]|nr:hypothetical protein [Bacteroidales bacterium]MCM1146485.1 hypothetical protein [Bacteroidales bacterium]MCM1205077.1 hypothetical protein [Bacillota bacterium]MCM1509323.1 hypothetical protein [Clostridium sp.]